MSDEEKRDLIKKESPNIVDNFEGWEDGIEGDDRPQGAGIIQGTLVKFTNEAEWTTRDGDALAANLELVAVDVARVVQKWQDQQPVETIILQPHQKFPDIEEMNEKVPKKEWVEGPDGNLRGPWQAQHIVYLLDPKTMDKYTFPTGTTGGRIGVRELVDKTMWMRRLRGPSVHPVITLADAFMKTKWGGRQRPHFKIVRWVRLGGEGGEVEALPPPTPPPPQTTAQSDLPLKEVEEPSLKEEMGDEIPFDDAVPDLGKAESPKAAAPPLPTPRRDLKKSAKTSAKKPPSKRRSNILDAG
jgi:hypothetical protein